MSHVIWTILTLVEILCAAGQEGNGPFISPLNSELDIFYTFAPSNTGEFRTLTIGNDKETLFIGAKERVFGQTLDDIRINAFPPIVWAASDKQSCSLIPQSNGGKYCDNVIQVTLPLNDTHIMICGSNSMSPENKFLVRKDVESNFVIQDTSSLVVPLCSYDPLDSVTSLHTRSEDGDNNYFTVMNVMGSRLSLWKLAPGRINIQASERMTGESPEYVKMFFAQDATSSPAMEKVYAVTMETALETGPTRLPKPTIIQVCVNDIGGGNLLYRKWTSLLKVRLQCATTNDKYPLQFDRVTDMVRGSGDLLYGTFVTKHETARSNAICAFRLSDIQSAFKSNIFWDTTSAPYGQTSWENPSSYHPGMCAHPGMDARDLAKSTSIHFPDEFLRFMTNYFLVHDYVTPAFPSSDFADTPWTDGPLLVEHGGEFIKIAVQQVTDFTGDVHDVLFVGKDNGQILKLVSVKVNDEVKTTELASYEPSTDPVLTMLISQEKELLYVGTKNGVYQLSTRDCSSYTKSCEFCDACSMCVLSQDPGCGWDASKKQCISSNEVGATVKQDVRHGNASLLCDPTEKEGVTAEVSGDSSTLLGHVVKSQSVTAVWWKYESSTITRVTELATKYRINNDGQLEIINFDYGTDSLVYESEYYAKDTIVHVTSFDLSHLKNDPADQVTDTLPDINEQDAGNDTLNDDLVEEEVPEIEKTTMPGVTYALGASMVTIVVLVALLLQKSQRNCGLRRNSESGQSGPDTPGHTHRRPRQHRPKTPRPNRPQSKTSNSKPHRKKSSQSETLRTKQFQSNTHRQKPPHSKTSRPKEHESEAAQPMTPEYETPQPGKSQSETSSHSYPINYV